MFEAWRGRYSDSPRVVSETLGEVAPEIERRWVASDPSTFPSDVTCIPRHRPRYFLDLATCDLLVTNDIVTRHLVKGPRVLYTQAWHGSPIKVIGLDEPAPKYRNGAKHLKRMVRDVAKWDFLLSNSESYTRIFRSAFGYEGEVLEIGYPRNDILVNDNGTRRARARRELGIDEGEQVVLYAPTWRDDAHDKSGGFFHPELIDWDLLDQLLPEGTVILNRLHQHVVTDDSASLPARVRDVSRHEDVTELILASDALVSDYSSMIYDYALTGRPIILHAPDLDRYRSDVRPFYFDFESWAPGPITSSTEELADQLLSLAGVSTQYADTYRSFVDRFCTFEDGRSSERLVAKLLERLS
jgi:CDP-glycerol glycerophosphotransferase